jgi:hypothetical protein
MNLPALDRAVLTRRLAQVAQLRETYVPKTGQTGQTGQHIENATEYSSRAGQYLSGCPLKLASGTCQRRIRPVPGRRPRSVTHGEPSEGAP